MEKSFTANEVAQLVSRLAVAILIIGVIGSFIIAVTPTETCGDTGYFGTEECVKDWTTSLTTGLVGLLINSLVMLSIMMAALYILERTSMTEK